MHDGQLEVTAELVGRLVRAQYPEWSALPVRAVRSAGTVNALFRIGDRLVARLPLVPDDPAAAGRELADEAEAAKRLRGISPYPTPETVVIGGPGEGYPMPWAVQTWLDGTVASEADVAGSTGFAEDLARFVRALWTAPTEGRTFTGSWRGGSLSSQDESVADHLGHCEELIDVAALRRLWSDLRTTPRTEPDTWAHRDLMPGNLLVAEGKLAAVIDVGTFAVADPAIELQPAWNLLDEPARQAFRAATGCAGDRWRRGMGWAFAQAVGSLWYYAETNPVMSRTAYRTLTALLEER